MRNARPPERATPKKTIGAKDNPPPPGLADYTQTEPCLTFHQDEVGEWKRTRQSRDSDETLN